MTPPVARQYPHLLKAHGEIRQDHYYWLRDREDPAVIAYLEAENSYTAEVMAPQAALVEQINSEILSRIQQTDQTVPARRGDWLYYSRTEEGKQYPIYCRKQQQEEIMLDLNQLAQGKDYFALGGLAVSEDAQYLAFLVDENGSEEYTVRVKDLRTGALLPDAISDCSHGIAWANDSRTLYYVRFDRTKRPETVIRHILGSDPATDEIVFVEPDPRFTFELGKTRSGNFLVVTSINASTTSEIFLLDANAPPGRFTSFAGRETGVEYYIDHQGDRFLIRTNANGARRFQLCQAPVGQTAREHWRPLRPEMPGSTLDEVHAFESFLALETREAGLPAIRILEGTEEHVLTFPEPSYTAAIAENFEYRASSLRYVYTSLATPLSTYEYHLPTRTSTLLKRTEVPGGFDPSRYITERLEASAPDGTPIPISLLRVAPAHGRATQPSPLLLYGYGSYGINTDARFTVSYFSLVDRGFTVALAHIRGGSENGREWFEQGRMLHKQNTFSDFISCAEHLIAKGYTAPEKLCAMGGSAGGLLMGAVINQRPDLFHSVVALVPFVDVVTTMSDPSIPLTTGEYDQWGNPEDEPSYRYMKSYSPYDNVAAQRYPNLLVTTGLNDPRVAYWEPAKWVAKLRVTKTDNNLLLLKTELGAGHGGPSGRYNKYRETAFLYAFLLQ